MKYMILVVLLNSVLIQNLLSQELDTVKLNDYFTTLEVNDRFMGSVAVSKGGQLIYTRSVGYIDMESKIKANDESRYRIGSISKTFTAVLVLKAIEQGKLKLNQTIETFFPTLKNAEQITVRHLLNHRSGVHNFTNDKEYLKWATARKTESEMVDIIAKGGIDFSPGSKSEYSNSNFVLLTFMLEKSFKKSYSELLTTYITKPVGLTHTGLVKTINPANNECNSYAYEQGWKLQQATDISVAQGGGGIVSTPSELVKFSGALFAGKLLKGTSLELMTNIVDRFGMGLIQVPFHNQIGYGHNGGIDGFTSIFIHFDEGDVSYALTSNGTNFDNNDISIAILSAVYGKPYNIPEFKTFDVSVGSLNKYIGVYSSEQIPIKITVTNNGKMLTAQATGQSPFPLEASAQDQFKFDRAGIVMEFIPAEKTMILKQGGKEFLFKRE